MKVKVSSLPIYEEPEEIYRYEYVVKEPSKLELGIRGVRVATEDFAARHKETIDKTVHIYETGKAHSKEAVYYILDEENVAARAGLITLGGVLGLVKARRGNVLKKLAYTSMGASAAAAVLYPRDTYNIAAGEGVRLKKLALIAYNFALGAKPEEKTKVVEKPAKTFEQDLTPPTPSPVAVVEDVSVQDLTPPAPSPVDASLPTADAGDAAAPRAEASEITAAPEAAEPASISDTAALQDLTPPTPSPVTVVENVSVEDLMPPTPSPVDASLPTADAGDAAVTQAEATETPAAPEAAEPTSVEAPASDVPEKPVEAEKITEEVIAEVQELATVAATLAAEVVDAVVEEIEKSSKDKVVEIGELPKVVVEGDLGQGNPEDSELYTTR